MAMKPLKILVLMLYRAQPTFNEKVMKRDQKNKNLGGLILVLKFSYSGSKYGQQTFAIRPQLHQSTNERLRSRATIEFTRCLVKT